MISSTSSAHSDPSYHVLNATVMSYPLIVHSIPSLIAVIVLISVVFDILFVSDVSVLVSAAY